MQDNTFAIETFSLTKVFSDLWGRVKVQAVNKLDLQIRYNEVFGLLGPNGSGKTTTIKMLLGLLHPTKGRALMLGGDSTEPKINSRIGFLPEESYLYTYLTARETLDFYGRLFGLPSPVRKARIESLLDMVGLKAVANRPVGTFSKGMARRIGLAQALINDPDLLILDEPTTGLDPIGTRQIKDLILQLAKRGKTILLCSHLLADVEDVCDRISVLYGGQIQAQGKVRELLQQSDKTQITADSLSEDSLRKVRQLLDTEKKAYEISSPMERLETFFIRTVVEAQKQAIPTSGAVSTTQIGEFLAAEARQQTILDKLVTASPASKTQDSVKTAKTVPAETKESDNKLLEQLTGAGLQDTNVQLSKTEPVKEQPDSNKEIDIDLLKKLTESQKNVENKSTNNEGGQGGSGHA